MTILKTWIVKAENDRVEEKDMKKLGEIIAAGGLVAFPTETVYGLGASAFDENAASMIYAAKGRPSDNPLIVHISDYSELDTVVREIPKGAELLFSHFSPGPLTVIMKKADTLAKTVTAGLDTVAVRIPSNPVARALIKASGVPIAAPSANISGKPSPTTAKHVIADMDGKIDAVIDGADCDVGVESTIIDMTGDKPVMLRPGGITYSEIKKLLPDIEIDRHITEAVTVKDKPKCPGMKYKHYAPDADVTVVEGKLSEIREKIRQLIEDERKNQNRRIGVLAYDGGEYDADYIIYSGKDNRSYAHNLFRDLREFDENGVDIVFAEFVYDVDYGLAVKNRLYKSAGDKVIHL